MFVTNQSFIFKGRDTVSSWPPSRMSVLSAYDERFLSNISLPTPLIEAASCVGILKYTLFFFVLWLRKKSPNNTDGISKITLSTWNRIRSLSRQGQASESED